MHTCVKSLQSCPILGDPMDCSPPGSSVHGILQARIQEWVALPFSRGSSGPRDQTHISYVSCRQVLYPLSHQGTLGMLLTKVHILFYWAYPWASLLAQLVKNLPAMWETWVRSLGLEDPLEKGRATHSSILAWRIPWTEESGRLQSSPGGHKSLTQLSGCHFTSILFQFL